MKFTEAMVYYNFNGAEIARVLGLKRQTIQAWKLTDCIPLHHQKTLEQLTNNALKADSPEELKKHKILAKRGLRNLLINESQEKIKNAL